MEQAKQTMPEVLEREVPLGKWTRHHLAEKGRSGSATALK
jgi:hypothetical protein